MCVCVCVNYTNTLSDRKIVQNVRVLAIGIETQKIANILNIVSKSMLTITEQSKPKSLYHHYCHIHFEKFCSQPSLNDVEESEKKKYDWCWARVCILRAGRENLPPLAAVCGCSLTGGVSLGRVGRKSHHGSFGSLGNLWRRPHP